MTGDPTAATGLALVEVRMTAPDPGCAQRIVDTLLDERLAACAQLLPDVRSTYRWQGEVEHASETLVLLKTTQDRCADLLARARALHPYELPELVAVPVSVADAGYAAWVADSVTPA